MLQHEASIWRRGADRVDPLPLGPEGVSWSISERDGWIAEAHPHADLIRITTPTGRTFDLACFFPFSVAWAGPSLVVVSTTSGHVLLFPNVRHVLSAWD
jgi:hypothetical protein